MSRFRQVFHGAASGYMVQVATALYSLVTVPLALHYLSAERFALWALMSSIGSYMSLIDFGMSGSVARLLIDHKDDRERGAYGSFLLTGWLVLIVQGLIIFVLGLVLAPILVGLLDIQPDLGSEFVQLMRWQTTVWALGFILRISGHLLYANQRLEVTGYIQVGGLALSFALLWFFFHARQGVFSLAWANLLTSLAGGLVSMVLCWRLRLFPPAGAWGRPSRQYFLEIFGYGKDMFLVAVGAQLITASQTLIITRELGLQVAAAWSVGTRAFTAVSQAVWRISDVSGPGLAEMVARGEDVLLRKRYQALVIMTASLSGFGAVGFALCNSPLVTILSHGKLVWSPTNDILLGAWMMVSAVLHCHSGFVLLTKKIGFMRYVFFVEGLVFVTAAFFVARRGGLPAMILCSIVCSTVFSGAYGIWRISRYFSLPIREVALTWLAPMARVVLLFAPVAMATWWATQRLEHPVTQLALNASIGGCVGLILFLRYGLSLDVQAELLQRAPRALSPVLKRVFGSLPK
jgi:O-antigen/teichoic acid export membrane protein